MNRLESIMVRFYIAHANCLVLNANYAGAVEHALFVVKEQCRLSSLVNLSVFADATLSPREDLIRQWLSDE